MDWKKTFNQGQWVIHSIFVIAVIIGVGSTIYAFRLNHLHSTEEERVLKINSLIQYLRQDNSFEKVGKYLSWAEADKAHDKLRQLNGKLAETEELLEIKASQDLSLGLRTFNKLISNNSGMSNPTDALKVLGQKVNALADVATSQKYKNIETVTDKMKERMGQLTSKNVSESIQVNYLKTDLGRLVQMTATSNLSDGEKSSLNNRYESMKYELELLGNLNSQSRDLKSHVNQATIAMSQWLMDAEKKSTNLRGMKIQKQNQLIIMLTSLVGFMVVAWMGLAYLFRWQRNKIAIQIENEVKNVIEQGILGDQRYMVDHYSDHTREDIVRLLDELKIKLSLGTLLHEGLPFAGCMIDNNFKLTWHNHLFLEQLYLSDEEVRSDAFNWDYVRDYLNLDEDPIYQAMVNKIAGIYPVKVKQDELTPSQPYEMYVTPISANREDRVMVFFYPLVSVREAIDEQVELTRTSINRFVDVWNENKMDQDELRLLERNFKNHDLSELYHVLVSIFERVDAEKNECLMAIRSLEKENDELSGIIREMGVIEEEKKAIIKEEVKIAHDLRNSVVVSLEKNESLFQINRMIMQQNDDFKNEAMKLQQEAQEVAKKNRETLDILSQVDGVKADNKKLKFELMEVKAKLISFNNHLFAQLPPLDENQQKLAMRYKDELARLEVNVSTLDKKLSQLDVLISKLSMMHEKKNVAQTAFNFQTSQKDHEVRAAIQDIQKILGQEEGKIVEHFKNLHVLMKKDLRQANLASSMVQAPHENLLS